MDPDAYSVRFHIHTGRGEGSTGVGGARRREAGTGEGEEEEATNGEERNRPRDKELTGERLNPLKYKLNHVANTGGPHHRGAIK